MAEAHREPASHSSGSEGIMWLAHPPQYGVDPPAGQKDASENDPGLYDLNVWIPESERRVTPCSIRHRAIVGNRQWPYGLAAQLGQTPRGIGGRPCRQRHHSGQAY